MGVNLKLQRGIEEEQQSIERAKQDGNHEQQIEATAPTRERLTEKEKVKIKEMAEAGASTSEIVKALGKPENAKNTINSHISRNKIKRGKDKAKEEVPALPLKAEDKAAEQTKNPIQEKSSRAETENFSIRASKETISDLRAYAKISKQNISEITTNAIKDYMKKHPLTPEQQKKADKLKEVLQ